MDFLPAKIQSQEAGGQTSQNSQLGSGQARRNTSSRAQAGRLLNAVRGEEGARRGLALGLSHAYELLPPGL